MELFAELGQLLQLILVHGADRGVEDGPDGKPAPGRTERRLESERGAVHLRTAPLLQRSKYTRRPQSLEDVLTLGEHIVQRGRPERAALAVGHVFSDLLHVLLP